MNRRFLNLLVENCSRASYSLRRIELADHLFYRSTTVAEAAMERSEAAIKENAEMQAGYKHGLRSLKAMATSLGPLPAARINFEPTGSDIQGEPSFDFVALLGDESRILCGDSYGRTSLYDADSHAVLTVPDIGTSKGRLAIPISIPRAADGHGRQHDGLYVMSRTPDPDFEEFCFEELRFGGGQHLCSEYHWTSLPAPPFVHHPAYELPADIGAHAVVGSDIHVSSLAPGIGTYSFDTLSRKWRRAGEMDAAVLGQSRAHVPELGLWFGLSASRPFHLCAADLSALDCQRPPAVQCTWVDLHMPKSWSPFHLDLINLGSGRFCVVKMFDGTCPPVEVGFSDDEDDGDEVIDYNDVIHWEFAVLMGIEVVRESPGEFRMVRHMSRFHIFEDHNIEWVL